MIILVRDVLPSDTLLLVDHPEEASLDDVLQVGVEYVVVRGSTVSNAIFVQRGAFGSPRAFHAAGSAVTPVQVVTQTAAPSAPPPATAGSAQTVSLLGPYAIAFDTPNLNETHGVALAVDVVPADANVVRMWVVIDTAFDVVSGTKLFVGIGHDISGGDGQPLIEVDDINLNSPVITPIGTEAPPGGAAVPLPLIGVTTIDASIYAFMLNNGDPATQGTGRVFALIATPA